MFGRHSDEESFHRKGSMPQVMQHQSHQMRDAINHLAEAKLKAVPVEQLAEEIAEKFSINMPVLDEAAIRPATREVDIDFPGDPTRMAFHMGQRSIQKGTEISISVPFQGDAEVFRLHASSHTMEYPRGRIERSEIVFRRQGVDLDGSQVRREFDDWLAQIKRHLTGMTQELGGFNDSLVGEALSALNARIAKLQRDGDVLAGLGFGTPPQGRS